VCVHLKRIEVHWLLVDVDCDAYLPNGAPKKKKENADAKAESMEAERIQCKIETSLGRSREQKMRYLKLTV